MTAEDAFIMFILLAPALSIVGLAIYQYGRIWRDLADSWKDWR